ncbi:MAG: dockerin type I repeat-containing protein [Euryarchaeota archaeon]|nr:dockerin type I repeat-containing protein [Euryarchaeota archaeon]
MLVIRLSKLGYDSTTDEYTASVYAKRGYDGHQFWSQSVTGEDIWLETDYCNWYYYSSQDFDGDSLDDLLITTGTSIDYYNIPTKVCAVKGSDGTSFWCKSSAPPVTGDLNGDGKLTPADAVIALDIAVSGDYDKNADVNDDDVVNSLDVLMILQAAASSIML